MTEILIAIGALLAGLAAAFLAGRRGAKQESALDAAERYAKTRKDMDNVEGGADPAVLREWLRNRDPRD